MGLQFTKKICNYLIIKYLHKTKHLAFIGVVGLRATAQGKED
jgi:hypothetical protein